MARYRTTNKVRVREIFMKDVLAKALWPYSRDNHTSGVIWVILFRSDGSGQTCGGKDWVEIGGLN